MSDEQVTISGYKKIIAIALAGTVSVISLLGVFVQSARDYAVTTVKALLGALEIIIK